MLVGDGAEQFLLATAKGVPADVLSSVQIVAAPVVMDFRFLEPIRGDFFLLDTIPDYDPADWNPFPDRLARNNCYNYSTNKPQNDWAQPGCGSNIHTDTWECAHMTRGAIGDGLVAVDSTAAPLKSGHYVALVLRPGHDFHFYRKDQSGYWSHKPGGSPVRNWDSNYVLITSPQTCARPDHPLFCGYFVADEPNVRICGHGPPRG